MRRDLSSGQGIGVSIFSGNSVTKNDVQHIRDFDIAMKNGSTTAQAWQKHMTGCTVAAKQQAKQCLINKGSLTELVNGLQQTTIKAKLATVGLKALSVAGNMLMMMGISMAISGIIKGFQALANAQENAIEKANEFINKFEEQRDKLTSNKQAIDSMSSDYEKLAKGVDSLGRNVSLNSDEYARYNEIVNQIADMFPHMVQGYTDEGNAIIKCKGDIEKLTQAYKDQKDAAQDAIIVGSAEVFAGFKASTDKNPKYIWEESGLLQMKELVDKIVATGGDVEKIQGIINDLGGNSLVIGDVFDKIGLDKGWFDWNTQDAEYISENIKKFQSLFNTLNTEVEAQAAKIKPIMQAYLEQSEKFQLADDKVQDMVKQIVGQFDAEFYNQFDSEAQMASWVEENVIDKLRGNKGLVNDFSVVFDLQTKFNAGDITVAEYQEKLTAFLSLIDTLPDETQKAIKLLFGITTNDDGTASSDVDTMVKNVKDKFKGKFDKEIGQLKFDELEILADLDISPDGIKDWSEVEALIANAGKEVNKMTVSISDLEKASDGIKTLGSACKELSDDGHITTKTLGEIKTATGLADDEWAGYESTLLDAKKGSAEFNQAMSDLTYKILEHEMGSEKLANATEEQIAAVLRENGVLNANAVAESIVIAEKNKKLSQSTELAQAYLYENFTIEELVKKTDEEIAALLTEAGITSTLEERTYAVAKAKANAALASYDGTEASYANAASLLSECGSADIAQQAMIGLKNAQDIYNISNLDVSQKLQALQELGYFLQHDTSLMQNLASTSITFSDGKWWVNSFDENGNWLGSDEYHGFDFNPIEYTVPQFKNPSSSIQDANKKLAESVKQENLEILKQGIEEATQYINRFTQLVDIQDLRFELADDSDYTTKMDSLLNKYDLLKEKTSAMRDEFERLNGITPTSADEAEALASRMESLGSEMRSNVKDVISLRREIELLNVEMISNVANDAEEQLDRMITRLDRDIENISNGNIFSEDLFNLDFMLPVVSESALQKKKRENDKLISEERRYQDEIYNVITTSLKMQAEENAKARAEERASLQADLETTKGVVTEKSSEIKQSATQSAEETKTEVLTRADEIKTGISNTISDIANMQIDPPKLNTEAWDGLESDIQARFNRMFTWGGNGSRSSLVNAAASHIGQNNANGQFSNGRIEAWCADFVSSIAREVGISEDVIPTTASVWDLYNFFKNKGALSYIPQIGSLVMFDWHDGGNPYDHIGIVEDFDDNYIYTIEGNTSGGIVSRQKRPRNNTIIGYGIPSYSDGSSSHPGGYAVVGDNPSGNNVKRPELAIYPDGHVELVGQSGVEIRDFPEGTKIVPYDETKKILGHSSSIPAYASGTNEAERKKFDELLEKYKVPSYYDKSTAAEYVDYANQRKIVINNIIAKVDELSSLDIDSDEYNPLRDAILGALNVQTLQDNDFLYGFKNKTLNKTKEEYQTFYDELLESYRDYIERINAEDSEEIYDEEVIQEYIDSMEDVQSKLSSIREQISSTLESIIETYRKINEFNTRKLQEPISAMLAENSEWEKRYSIEKNLKYQKYIMTNQNRIVEQAVNNQDVYHNNAKGVRGKLADILPAGFDIESWFDKEGNFTTRYEDDLKLITDDEQKNLVQIYANSLSDFKKGWWESEEIILEQTDSIRQTQTDLLVQALQSDFEKVEDNIQKIKERNDFEISQYSAKETLLQKHYDLLNSIGEEQHNITKEINASLTMYEYLDEETRKLLFNQDDYNVLTKELNACLEEADEIQSNYLSAINNADLSNIEAITADYERQYELVMKKYEITKAELEVSKKRQQLDNVLNERNVRMLINGQWKWVANTQDVIDAQNELADAEYAKSQAENNLTQTKDMQSLQAHQDILKMQNNYLDEELSNMTEKLDGIVASLGNEVMSTAEVMDMIALSGGEGIGKIVNSVGSELTNLYNFLAKFNGNDLYDDTFDSGIDYSEIMAEIPTNSLMWEILNQKRNNKIDILNLVEKKYASGTRSAKKGLAQINEDGDEIIVTKYGQLIPMANFSGGENVFTHEMTENLWKQAQIPINQMLTDVPKVNQMNQTTEHNNNFSGNIIIQNPQNYDDFLSQLNKAVAMRSPITKYSRNR